MARHKVVRGEGETRRHILEVAVRHFANASYDDVGLREIAAEVGVDVAYVHRSFGSKEKLFREVIEVLDKGAGFSGVEAEDLSACLARMFVERAHAGKAEGVDPFLVLVLVRSLTSSKAGRIVGERLQSEFIGPISAKLVDPTQFRASMIMSLLIGLSILRNLVQLPAITKIDAKDAETLVAAVCEAIIGFTNVESWNETGADGHA